MELEELTKNQIILLTILISFVTSIATGIITFSLMNEVPLTVTQTIQRVVEKTIEKVTPDNKTTTVKETTVIVNEEDVITKVISDNEKSVVRIGKNPREESFSFVSLGFVTSSSNIIVADSDFVVSGGSYYAKTYDGFIVPLEIIKIIPEKNIVFLKALLSEGLTLTPVKFGNSDSLKLGQTAIVISGERSNEITMGIFSNFSKEKVFSSDGKVEQEIVTRIKTNLNLSNNASGGPLISLAGEVVGINIVNQNGEFTVPSNIIKKELGNLSTRQSSTENNDETSKETSLSEQNTATVINGN